MNNYKEFYKGNQEMDVETATNLSKTWKGTKILRKMGYGLECNSEGCKLINYKDISDTEIGIKMSKVEDILGTNLYNQLGLRSGIEDISTTPSTKEQTLYAKGVYDGLQSLDESISTETLHHIQGIHAAMMYTTGKDVTLCYQGDDLWFEIKKLNLDGYKHVNSIVPITNRNSGKISRKHLETLELKDLSMLIVEMIKSVI